MQNERREIYSPEKGRALGSASAADCWEKMPELFG
jgi:hypothetical protein